MSNFYFDNGSTSFPKPKSVADSIVYYLEQLGGSYGRGHSTRTIECCRLVEECRDFVACLLGDPLIDDSDCGNGDHIIFTKSATESLNLIINSLLQIKSRVFISPLEHHAVTRVLWQLKQDKKRKLEVKILKAQSDGLIDLLDLEKRVRLGEVDSNSFFIINHQSNINGVLQPISQIRKILSNREHIPMVVDGAQSVGLYSQRLALNDIDFLVWTGHKSLLGPTGIGGIWGKDFSLLQPICYGGTGSLSHSFSQVPKGIKDPSFFESGTFNMVGIVGLLGALKSYNKIKVGHTRDDFLNMVDEIKSIAKRSFEKDRNVKNKIKVICARESAHQGELFSLATEDNSSFAYDLDSNFKIETRVGLHCAPMGHFFLGTYPQGTVRFSTSIYHGQNDFIYLVKAIEKICFR